MQKLFYAIVGLLILAAGYRLGKWDKIQSAGASGTTARQILYYHDPMHPAYRSQKPGIAPDCGMALEPVYSDEAESARPQANAAPLPPGVLHINTERQQRIGVRIGQVEHAPVDHVIRTAGRVAADDTRIVRMTAHDGWVQTVLPAAARNMVRKGELLATFYSKEYLSAQQNYLSRQDTLSRIAKDKLDLPNQALVQTISAEKELLALGMSEYQIREIGRTRRFSTDIELRAPIDGFVLARNVLAGMKFGENTELFRIANLGRVWILADMFENEARHFRQGMKARILLPHQGLALEAKVGDVFPPIDPAARAFKVRLEAENPGYVLRPDMFVDVELSVRLPAVTTVPADAVIDSGLRRQVFVDLGDGRFEARPVETGWSLGDRVQIVNGLRAGERIVESGNFLLDSESRIQRAAVPAGRQEIARDPVCGMNIRPDQRAAQSTFRGKHYSFCSDLCRMRFDKQPEQYLSKNREAVASSSVAAAR